MTNAYKVCRFRKNKQSITLYVDSVQRKSEYWLEVSAGNGEVATSEKVFTWNEALALLESHQWDQYETDYVDSAFFDLVMEAKKRMGGTAKAKGYNAQQRLLEILNRLERNETINVQQAIQEFKVKSTQIQRDIKALREFFQYTNQDIDYVRSKKGYELTEKGDYFSIHDALIVLLFLYGTRALNKEELKTFSEKIIRLFSRAEQIKIREFFQSYLYYYKPVQENNLFDLFYTCFEAITQKRYLKFAYTNNKGETKEREAAPFTITYHDRKFYLHARLKGLEDQEPYVFQLDRMGDCEMTNEKTHRQTDNMKIGEYAQKAFYMYAGDVVKVKLKIRKSNVDFLKRNFPEVIISGIGENDWVEARLEVMGYMGIKLWVLQQGPAVEVLEPAELREEVKELIAEMHGMYFAPSRV
ncbi:helix-turn-helix transcriptional regulator [Neobacillus sp. Marseille-QA0830]